MWWTLWMLCRLIKSSLCASCLFFVSNLSVVGPENWQIHPAKLECLKYSQDSLEGLLINNNSEMSISNWNKIRQQNLHFHGALVKSCQKNDLQNLDLSFRFCSCLTSNKLYIHIKSISWAYLEEKLMCFGSNHFILSILPAAWPVAGCSFQKFRNSLKLPDARKIDFIHFHLCVLYT